MCSQLRLSLYLVRFHLPTCLSPVNAYVLSQIKAHILKGSLDISLKVYLICYGNGVIAKKSSSIVGWKRNRDQKKAGAGNAQDNQHCWGWGAQKANPSPSANTETS